MTSSRAGTDGGFRESGLTPEEIAWGVPAPPRSYWPARLVAITVLVPHRTNVAAPARRVLAILVIGLVSVANMFNLGLLINELLKGRVQNGRELVLSSVAIWLTNAIAFGLWYWELDRGGP